MAGGFRSPGIYDRIQEQFGSEAGLHRAYIGQIERGEKNIGLQNLEKIAKTLGVSIKNLL